jgi:type I restriction enzyme S subunit
MIADLKPYPEYKESGLPWLGHVPGHWGLVPNRGLIRRRKVLVGKHHSDYQLLSLTKQGVIIRDISAGKGKFSSDMGTSQEVRNGDLVFCLFDVPETPRTVGLSRHDGMITGAYTVFESLGRGSSEYFELFYRAMDDRKLLSPLYSGLRNTIPAEIFLGTKTPQPPPTEQAAIVRFLDWANGRLERAIRAKRKVIALLNEQKQAIIHRAVTRGLDPSVPLKPSGIPWLGDIPQHWEIIRNMALFAHRVEAGNQDLPILQVSLRSGITAEALDQFGRPKKLIADPMKYKRIYKGDIAYNTMRMWQGAVGVSPCDGLVSPAYVVLSPRTGTCAEYYDFIFHTNVYKQQVNSQSTGIVSDRNRLYWDSFKQMPNICLPFNEQVKIVEFLLSETSNLSTVIFNRQREIDLLREYRIRLVADVVTGKLDVREAATRLPKEPESYTSENETDLNDDTETVDEEVDA